MSENIYENDVILKDLANQIKSLEEEKQTIEALLQKYRIKADKLTETENIIKEKQSIPNLSAATIDKLSEMLASVSEQIAEINTEIDAESSVINHINTEILNLSESQKKREKELQNEAVDEDILAELETLEGIKNEDEIKIENNENNEVSVSMKIVDDDGEIDKIKKAIQEIKAQRDKKVDENDKLREKYQEEISRLREKLKIIEEKQNTPGISDATAEKLNEMFDEVEAQIDEINDKIDELNDNLDEFDDRIEELEGLLEESVENGEVDEELIASLEEQLAEIGGEEPKNKDKNKEKLKAKDKNILDALNIKIPEIKIPKIDIPQFNIKIPEIKIPHFNFNNKSDFNYAENSDEMTFDDIAALAPFASQETLDKLINKLDNIGDFSKISKLAPFLSRETLDKLVEKCEETQDFKSISKIAPFLSYETLDRLVEKCESDADFNAIAKLAPFLRKETLEKLITNSKGKIDIKGLRRIAPFLDRSMIDDIINSIEDM